MYNACLLSFYKNKFIQRSWVCLWWGQPRLWQIPYTMPRRLRLVTASVCTPSCCPLYRPTLGWTPRSLSSWQSSCCQWLSMTSFISKFWVNVIKIHITQGIVCTTGGRNGHPVTRRASVSLEHPLVWACSLGNTSIHPNILPSTGARMSEHSRGGGWSVLFFSLCLGLSSLELSKLPTQTTPPYPSLLYPLLNGAIQPNTTVRKQPWALLSWSFS